MNNKEILMKIINKKDFSKLPEKDILLAYSKFSKRECSEEEKIRLTRDLLRKVYSAFASSKLLNIKDKDLNWFLRKHLSTRERLNYYPTLYNKIFQNLKNCSIIDLGAGINGFSYNFFPKEVKINYIAVEAVGQLVNLMNFYFTKNKLNAEAFHESLFNLNRIKEIINNYESPRVIFLFKVIDSLEMLEVDYSKKLLNELVLICDKIVISFATRSMLKQERFKVNRRWIIDFIRENFELLDDYEIGNERYIEFRKKFKFK
ncbi:MAG: hypothetical protein ACP5NZ_03965 [Nanobdellota archaeon]